MQKGHLAISIIAVIVSFLGGFILANSLNKAELSRLRNAPAPTPAEAPQKDELSESEITETLKKAENNRDDFGFQKRLGLALYSYAASKNETKHLGDIEKLLVRANELNPNDYEVLVALANLNFDIATLRKEASRNEKAIELYRTALKANPTDPRVLSDLASVLLASKPEASQEAVQLLEKAKKADPQNELVLQNLAKAYVAVKDMPSAAKTMEELKKVNPQNPVVLEIDQGLKGGNAQ
ncbi:MAG: tetratricopeptide repeat protein [Pyrinomonadaceae bacterium]